MAWTSKKDREAVIELFTSGQVDRILWTYQAGGDSLNEYSTVFFLKGIQVEPDIFDPADFILDNVDISEASDGHYLGEFGTVTVTFENDDLVFDKSFKSEWNEDQYVSISIKLTDKEAEVARKIGELSVEVNEVYLDNINFKEDLYVSSEMTSIIKELVEKMCDFADAELEDVDGDVNEYKRMSKVGDLNSDNEMQCSIWYSTTEIVDEYGDR